MDLTVKAEEVIRRLQARLADATYTNCVLEAQLEKATAELNRKPEQTELIEANNE